MRTRRHHHPLATLFMVLVWIHFMVPYYAFVGMVKVVLWVLRNDSLHLPRFSRKLDPRIRRVQ